MTSKKKSTKAGTARPRMPERRRLLELREVLDELLTLVRHVSRNLDGMSKEEIEYAQQRLEWLADEAWRLIVEGSER